MNINQLTETNPIELARAVLTADDVQDFPIIHYAASQLLNALKTFEVEASYFEYEEEETLVRDFAIGDRLELLDGRVGVLTHVGLSIRYLTADDRSLIPIHGNEYARLHEPE
jgi:hypothetical protein